MAAVDASSSQTWAPGPPTAAASAGVVDIWRADLDADGDELETLLRADERERARQIRSPRDRRRWTRSRGVLRALLARYLGGDPRALRFVSSEHGKPMLAGAEPETDLRFNLSHSGALALYAVTAGHSVGIDVEVPRRQIDELAVAERVLGHEQAGRLAALDPQTRARAFLRAWVAHEAAVKCRGLGLGVPLEGAAGDLWSTELDVGPPAAAAVAREGGRCRLRCWEWQD
jgi:4'-phosphopantetheinyl transferase